MATEKVFYATGRRKTSAARVFLRSGSGQMTINGKKFELYMPNTANQLKVGRPFEATNNVGKFDAEITVEGGGESGQAGAICHALARAILASDETQRGILRKAGLLTRDPRMVERKKYGRHKARRSPQFSKR